MNVSLDDYIREGKSNPKTNMSLDEYIHMNNIKTPIHSYKSQNLNDQTDSGVSKFDRYKHQDEDDEDMDEDVSAKEMPKLVPFVQKTMPSKGKPIYQRLGERGSICESIHTSQMKLFRSNKFKAKNSVQNRLGKGYVNPAVKERNRIAMHALDVFRRNADYDVQGKLLLNAFTKAAIEQDEAVATEPKQKYDMEMQKEISMLQGKKLYYTCPGGFIVSSDGPGLRGMLKVPSHTTEISMNQRFA